MSYLFPSDFDYNLSTIFVWSLVFILTVLWLKTRRPSNVPPGPPAFFPILGNLVHFNEENFLQKLKEFRFKYGDVFSLKMGTKLVIVLNGYDAIKDALVKHGDVFSSRPDIFIFRETSQGQGIIGSAGEYWKEHRTFALSTLRSFGFGKRNLEARVMEEVRVFLNVLEETNGEPYDINHAIHTSISNVVSAIVFGQGFEQKDPRFMELLNIFEENFKAAGLAGPLTFLPFLKYIPFDLFGAYKVRRNARNMESFLYEMIKEHTESYDANNIRDFIDAFVKEMRQQNETKAETKADHNFAELHLMKVIGDLFLAATETTATVIKWAVLFFLYHPEIQDKMRSEMAEVIGQSKYPNMESRQNLPFCEAVVAEVLRCSNITPISVPHGMSCDANFRGYYIPKDAIILPNLDSILMDEEIFPEPEKFNPNRFLDNDGHFSNKEVFIPFSTGRRICLGESLARMELFLFLTSMVQMFKFVPEDSTILPSRDGILGITRSPKPYKCRILKVH